MNKNPEKAYLSLLEAIKITPKKAKLYVKKADLEVLLNNPIEAEKSIMQAHSLDQHMDLNQKMNDIRKQAKIA